MSEKPSTAQSFEDYSWHRTPDGGPRWIRCRRCGHEYFPFHQEGVFPADAASLAFKSGWNVGDHIHTLDGCTAVIDNGTPAPQKCACAGWLPGAFVTDHEIAQRDRLLAARTVAPKDGPWVYAENWDAPNGYIACGNEIMFACPNLKFDTPERNEMTRARRRKAAERVVELLNAGENK